MASSSASLLPARLNRLFNACGIEHGVNIEEVAGGTKISFDGFVPDETQQQIANALTEVVPSVASFENMSNRKASEQGGYIFIGCTPAELLTVKQRALSESLATCLGMENLSEGALGLEL